MDVVFLFGFGLLALGALIWRQVHDSHRAESSRRH